MPTNREFVAQTWRWTGSLPGDLLREQGESLLPTNPAAVQTGLRRGIIQCRFGKYLRAEEEIRAALRLSPQHAGGWSILGDLLRWQGRLAEAADCQQEVLKLQPQFGKAHHSLGNLHKDQGNLSEAAACYWRALAGGPPCERAHYSLGNLYQEQGNLTDAEACFRQALAREPHLAEAHFQLGEVLLAQGNHPEAFACFLNALEHKGGLELPGCRLSSALDLMQAAQGDAALPVVERIRLCRRSAQMLVSLDECAQAEQCMQQVLQLAPAAPALLRELALILRRQERFAEAVEVLQQVLRQTPSEAEVIRDLGALWADQEQLDKAQACYRQALALNPNDAETLLHAGILADRQGRREEACTAYRRAVTLRPACAEAHYLLAYLGWRGGPGGTDAAGLEQIRRSVLDFSAGRAVALQDDLLRGAFPDLWDQPSKNLLLGLLAKMDMVFQQQGVPYVLSFGTLLGWMRHGGLIPWDDDVDISVHDQDQGRLWTALQQLRAAGCGLVEYSGGFKIFAQQGLPIANVPHRWPFIDIFFHRIEGRWVDFAGFYQCPREALLPLRRGHFENLVLPIPAVPQQHLSAHYKRWRTLCVSNSFRHRTEQVTEEPILCVDSRRLRKLHRFVDGETA